MWADIETNRDYLNFRVLAGLVSQMILDANGRPLSIGISGGWGVGKSSMVKIVKEDIKERMVVSTTTGGAEKKDFLFVDFNAWFYQGHDDAKAALMEEIARALTEKAEAETTTLEKGRSLLKRIDAFRVLRLVTEVGLTAASGIPVGGLLRTGKGLWDMFTDDDVSADDMLAAEDALSKHSGDVGGFVKPRKAETPPQMIKEIRKQFEELLEELKVTLVVFVDDLDRCLPPTVIGTLEAMRLFLFMDRTAFIIAADDKMIKESVRVQFSSARPDDDIVTSYFDKLIQIPLRVPPLGTNEVKAYLMMLFAENSNLDQQVLERVREKVNEQLASSWKGNAITAAFVQGLIPNCSTELKAELELADRLARQMVASPKVGGNPRLIKRFLNTLSIRRSLAKVQHIAVDDAMFAKLLLFERFAPVAAFNSLTEMISTAVDGKSEALAKLEETVRANKSVDDDLWPAGWKDASKDIEDWLKLSPSFSGVDLRGALHVGRESAPIIAAEHKLSKQAAEVLSNLLTLKVGATKELKTSIAAVPGAERAVMMDNLLERANSEKEWGLPPILFGLEALADADPVQAERLVTFLGDRPGSALKPGLIARVEAKPWAPKLMEILEQRTDLGAPVSKAVKKARD